MSRNTKVLALVAGLVLTLGACSSGSDSDVENTTTTIPAATTTTTPRTKNAALNWTVQTPTGQVQPGGAKPPGLNVRPVRP